MIRTKNAIYNNRDSNTTSHIYIEINEEINDKENEQYLFSVVDYVFENNQKKIINSKIVKRSYEERDALKSYLINEYNITDTESEINKQLLPYALLYITQIAPIYNQAAEDFELNI